MRHVAELSNHTMLLQKFSAVLDNAESINQISSDFYMQILVEMKLVNLSDPSSLLFLRVGEGILELKGCTFFSYNECLDIEYIKALNALDLGGYSEEFRVIKTLERDLLEQGIRQVDLFEFLYICGFLNSRGSDTCVVPLTGVLFRSLSYLSRECPEFLRKSTSAWNGILFVQLLLEVIPKIPNHAAVTELCFPMGGGESFIQQTCLQRAAAGDFVHWLSSRNAFSGLFTQLKLNFNPYYVEVYIPLDPDFLGYQNVLNALDVDLIHSHGSMNRFVVSYSVSNRVPSLVGFHFWTDLIQLGASGNRDILNNLDYHKLTDEWLVERSWIRYYVASDFVHEVYMKLGGSKVLSVVYPTSFPITLPENISPRYIFISNLASLKGGNLILDVAKKLDSRYQFIGVLGEPDEAIARRIKKDLPSNFQIRDYGDIANFLSESWLVVVPTQVDETFCRIAYEACVAGIPVLTSGAGFLKQLLGDHSIYCDPVHIDQWVDAIELLFHDDSRRQQLIKSQRESVRKFEFSCSIFMGHCDSLMKFSKRRNIGIFTLWTDQGMGIGSRNYAKILRMLGYQVHIFEFQPYSKNGIPFSKRYNESEWLIPQNADSITTSNNQREDVTSEEIVSFIDEKNIGFLWITEICWQPNWTRILSILNQVYVLSVPCIETISKNEVALHKELDLNLCVTRWTLEVLRNYQINNTIYIGHGFSEISEQGHQDQTKEKTEPVRFVHFGSYNFDTRKNTKKVFDAFCDALNYRTNISLTIVVSSQSDFSLGPDAHPQVNLIKKDFSFTEILEMMRNHDVLIHVSSHEGLGLGLYESVANGCPVLSHAGKPHSEIVVRDKTGWVIAAQPVPLPDLKDGIVNAWTFMNEDLTKQIVNINHQEIDAIKNNMRNFYNDNFSEFTLAKRLIFSIPFSCRKYVVGSGLRIDYPQRVELTMSTRLKNRLKMIPWLYILVKRVRTGYRFFLSQIKSFVKLLQPGEIVWRAGKKYRSQIVSGLKRLLDVQTSELKEFFMEQMSEFEKVDSLHSHTSIPDSFGRVQHQVNLKFGGYPFVTYTPDLGCAQAVATFQEWENEISFLIKRFIRRDSICVDIGANIGYHSILMGHEIDSNGRVYAFEPHPYTFEILERNTFINRLEGKLVLNNFALGREFSVVQLFEDTKHLGITTRYPRIDSGNEVPVRIYSLDQLEMQKVKISIMKIDVEGMEIEVLEGARNSIARSTEKFLCVMEKNANYTSEELYSFSSIFPDAQFRTFLLSDFGRLCPLASDEISQARGHLVIVSLHQLSLITDLIV
jgi:FkbM family methyltransferase